MTSQLTPKRTAAPKPEISSANGRVYLQPWFWMALLSMVAIVFVVVSG